MTSLAEAGLKMVDWGDKNQTAVGVLAGAIAGLVTAVWAISAAAKAYTAVQAALNPRLAPSETLQLLLDGDPVGAPQRIANWQLTNVYRGEHKLQVVRLDERGVQLEASPASTVYVMRPIVNR